ncbi:MAG: HIRAN domain-containing protein [Clostridiales bacterium]|nr:HIRAN domain-containing protein [Clostridiales bacterium]
MAKLYFTITGTNFRYGDSFLEKDMKVRLIKEPDNEFDKEAIRVELEGLGKIGYVANSTRTVIGECHSAGYILDKIKDDAEGKIMYVTDNGIVGVVSKKSLV